MTISPILNLIGYSIVILPVYLYIGFKIINPLRMSFLKKIILYILVIFACYMPLVISAIPYASTSPKLFHGLLFQIFSWIGLSILGFCSILVVFLIIYDVCAFMMKIIVKPIKIINSYQLKKLHKIFLYLSEKHYIRKNVLYSLIIVSVFLTGYGIYKATGQCEINYITVPIKNLPEGLNGFRIVQLTDLHLGLLANQDDVQQIVERVNKLTPDIVAITGDLIDGNVEFFKDVISHLSKAKTRYGTFFITGNHEHYCYADKLLTELTRLKIKTLVNSHAVININNNKILIAGVTDHIAGKYEKDYATDPRRSIMNSPLCQVKIMLAHSPVSIYEVSKLGFDLQLSGHTHGGVYFPISLLVNLRNRLLNVDAQPFKKGLHKYHNTWIYVSSGIGYWGPPLRIGNPSEISVILLKKEKIINKAEIFKLKKYMLH